ncbi:alpha-amylase family glycosyl hydrolase [Leptolyngbya sp. FACHB-261]|uniref:alpha-amylase family glycosyl hydrolase n=1 Tax=Leptolyngbya sp. FACHB-261 TaxID=2692806 RepID=UPI0016846773|nr:alpha-amylase family glycosyl hydrolase [Leptolyngbya sp. FACHB-261]MBD2102858.1 alpha-amylase [Leptolyngbya sp. FACHB-261]
MHSLRISLLLSGFVLMGLACNASIAQQPVPSSATERVRCNFSATPTPPAISSPRVAEARERNVMVQLFDCRFKEIEAEIPNLVRMGYSHIHVSPPQKSNPADEWWGRYQPIDHTKIEGPLGTEAEFRSMNAAADRAGIDIVVDVVLNHMASYDKIVNLQFPRFSRADFHPQACISYGNRESETRGWIGSDCGLPDLDTSSPYVRQEAKNYLKMLLSYSVDGFRFDAIKHMEPEYFDDVVAAVPKEVFSVGEYISSSPTDLAPYLRNMDAFDFPLLSTMKGAFAFGGDLRSLVTPAASRQALPGPSAVTFVKNHDTANAQFGGFDMSGVDELLAYTYILGREEGFPYVFLDKYKHPLVLAGAKFHNLALGKPVLWTIAEANVLAWQRGRDSWVIINKAGEQLVRENLQTSLEDGDYVDLLSRRTLKVSQGRLPRVELGGSSAAFFVKAVP